MTDRFQLTTIIAGAIRECRAEASGQDGKTPPAHNARDTEEDHRIAKTILTALSDAGFEICPKKAAD
jgi:hypothetical protein